MDFVHYRRYDFTAKTNLWKEARCDAYVTFPPAAGTTNFAVERVDLGEAAPINAAVAELHQLFAGRRIAPQRLGALLYAPLARHLTNVAHLTVCPDGQLGHLPFELLLVDATYRYHLRLADPWRLEVQGGHLIVHAPLLRASLPPPSTQTRWRRTPSAAGAGALRKSCSGNCTAK